MSSEGALIESRLNERGLVLFVLLVALVGLMSAGYMWTQREVIITVNQRAFRFRTHQNSVGAVLREAGIEINEEDIVSPGLDEPLDEGDTISVHKAKTVHVQVDGQVIELRTHSRTIADLLQEAAITLQPRDQLTINGQEVSQETFLPDETGLPNAMSDERENKNPGLDPPLWVVIKRAVPIYVDDDGVLTTIYTTASTIGEALWDEHLVLYLGDQVKPALSAPVAAGVHLYIQRSKPVEILADGRRVKTRTREEAVAQVLAQEGIVLEGKDYTRPGGQAEIRDHMTIQVVRVDEKALIEEEPIPFETVWKADSTLEIDQQRLTQAGEIGLKRRQIRIVYENGVEVQRIVEDEWVAREPTTEIISYGTKIVVREKETPEGVIQYWREMKVLATSYCAATAGKPPDHPRYGITRTGVRVRRGVIAVDPKVISLGTKMYVPGYGMGIAADTGGLIRGRHIDLGYGDDELVLWRKWLTIYLLAPPPPPDQIRWVLPTWPEG